MRVRGHEIAHRPAIRSVLPSAAKDATGDRMRRVVAALALALSVLGCGLKAPGEPVALLTGNPLTDYAGVQGCYTSAAAGLLVVDATYGTAITDSHAGGPAVDWPTAPVMWPAGSTGRRLGFEVAVLDPAGNVVATTGRSYRLEGGYWSETIIPTKENHYAFSGPRVFLACGSVDPS